MTLRHVGRRLRSAVRGIVREALQMREDVRDLRVEIRRYADDETPFDPPAVMSGYSLDAEERRAVDRVLREAPRGLG